MLLKMLPELSLFIALAEEILGWFSEMIFCVSIVSSFSLLS